MAAQKESHAFSRAQLSIEALLLFLVFLSLLGISLAASSKISAAATKKMGEELSKSDFSEFSAKLSQACSFGNGNIRLVELKGHPAAIFQQGGIFNFSSDGFSAVETSACELEIVQPLAAKSFRIENKGGKIEVS